MTFRLGKFYILVLQLVLVGQVANGGCLATQIKRLAETQVHEPVEGLYESIPAERVVTEGTLKIRTSPSLFPVEGHHWSSKVEYTERGMTVAGTVDRMILNQDGKKNLIFNSAGLGEVARDTGIDGVTRDIRIPGQVALEGVPSLTSRGVPVQALVTMIQMKLSGVGYGELSGATVQNVVNTRVSLELGVLVREYQAQNPGRPITNEVLNDLIPYTHAARYASTVLEQSGHQIKRVYLDSYRTTTFDQIRLAERDALNPDVQALLGEGWQSNDSVYTGLTIKFELQRM